MSIPADLSQVNPTEMELFRNDSREYLKLEVLELRELLVALTSKYKVAEDRRKVMERRISNLIADNKVLQKQCMSAEGKRILSEREVATMQEKIQKFIVERGMDELKVIMDNPVVKLEAVTSTTDLQADRDTSGSTTETCDTSEKFENSSLVVQPDGDESVIVLTKSELNKLDSDMRELKEALDKREETWAKTSDRERSQRAKIQKLQTEVQNLRNLYNFKTKESDNKTKELTSKNDYVARLKKDLRDLRAALRGRRTVQECTRKPPLPAEARCGVKPKPSLVSTSTQNPAPPRKKTSLETEVSTRRTVHPQHAPIIKPPPRDSPTSSRCSGFRKIIPGVRFHLVGSNS